jgi:hypothetical protein
LFKFEDSSSIGSAKISIYFISTLGLLKSIIFFDNKGFASGMMKKVLTN